VVVVKEKELIARAAKDLGISGEVIDQHLQRMGRAIGRRGREDEKHASLAAWIASSRRIELVWGRTTDASVLEVLAYLPIF